MKNYKLTNKKMNDEVYKLRRKVISILYEAKKLYPSLPHIVVRVTENYDGIRAQALLNGGTIWISEKFVASRPTVFHEILHAAFGQSHVKNCRLMGTSSDQSLTKKECNNLFLKYVHNYESKSFIASAASCAESA